MKTLNEWFEEYGVSHKNITNKKIHYICVPLIFLSIVGLFMSIPNHSLLALAAIHPLFSNWAFIVILFVLFFYYRLSFTMGLKMTLFTTFCLIGNYLIDQTVPLLWFSIAVFAIG